MPEVARRMEWDLFCRVIDNYGDIGFCWRLAKCLAVEHDMAMRLWVDDLERFAQIEPLVDARRMQQEVAGVEILRWSGSMDQPRVADVVVQGFGSPLPSTYITAMAARARAPAWIDLEYLSAESWIDDFHGRSSPHPQEGLVKHFFFPGFTRKSGGLIREADLLNRRDAFLHDANACHDFWSRLGLPRVGQGERRLALFSYPNPRALDLWQILAGDASCDWSVVIPIGTLDAELSAYFAGVPPRVGAPARAGRLTIHLLPFLSQDDYDRLLWACDVNFVRGEDSFVRAQWAGRPFVWQIYPQEGQIHLAKLGAFLDLYLREWPEPSRGLVEAVWRAWNTSSVGLEGHWQAWWQDRAQWNDAVGQWPRTLSQQVDLATRLAQFARDLLK